MSLDEKLKMVMHELNLKLVNISPQHLISLIDYTSLNKDLSVKELQMFVQRAAERDVAAVCVYPEHLPHIPDTLHLVRATVVNFPEGTDSLSQTLKSIESVYHHTLVHEIDYVFPYQTYFNNNQKLALSHCHDAYSLCLQMGLTFKVILETGACPSLDMIYRLSSELIQIGCDFLKTSTGKIAIGATFPAAFAMLKAIQNANTVCGVKFSGGIKTVEQAKNYIHLAEFMLNQTADKSWLRIGASSLLDDCLSQA
jgi:deoxyribose-phosphate aldolase